GDSMKHMPFAARQMADFMISVDFIPEAPDLTKILDDQFVKAYAAAN
ncbi:MAG: aliphatic sulfonates ABC transporter substrate-binding protein, partial [Cyanobacteria bacterium J06642_3]